MSSKVSGSTAKTFLEKDFEILLTYMSDSGIKPPQWNETYEEILSRVHQTIYAISLWDFNLNLPEHSKTFLTEARSDAIASIPLALRGFQKQAALSIRQVLEDVLRHVYYSQHEVEFGWLARDESYMKWSELVRYASDLLLYDNRRLRDHTVQVLNKLYSDLSKLVHTRSPEYSRPSLSLKDIKFDDSFFKEYSQNANQVGSICNTILILFRWDEFKGFDGETKRAIKRTIFPPTYKLLMDND